MVLRARSWIPGESTAFALRKSFNIQINDDIVRQEEEVCGRREEEDGFYQQTAVSSAAVPGLEDTQRGFPQKAINEILLEGGWGWGWGAVEDCF